MSKSTNTIQTLISYVSSLKLQNRNYTARILTKFSNIKYVVYKARKMHKRVTTESTSKGPVPKNNEAIVMEETFNSQKTSSLSSSIYKSLTHSLDQLCNI
jgi:hypothetical protein